MTKGKKNSSIVPSKDMSLTRVEAQIIRGILAQQELVGIQMSKLRTEGDEVLEGVEKRLGLKAGSFMRDEVNLNLDKNVVEYVSPPKDSTKD